MIPCGEHGDQHGDQHVGRQATRQATLDEGMGQQGKMTGMTFTPYIGEVSNRAIVTLGP